MAGFGKLSLVFGIGWLVLGALPVEGCQQTGPQDRTDVVMFEMTDVEMEAAKAKGQATLPEFFRHLASPAGDENDFGVKFNLTPDGEAEYIWANHLHVGADGRLSGALANQPIDERFQLGQRVTIERSEIVDWSYFKRDVAKGHYTTRVMLDRAMPEQAREIRATLGW
jgi:uncharacterized protein YegJ (DUF2314 family)